MIQKIQDFGDSTYDRPHDKYLETEIGGGVVRERRLRSRRKVFTVACTAFTLGALLILFRSPFRNEILAPGPLSSNHAQLLAGTGADRCAACHGAGKVGFSAWLVDAFTVGKNIGNCQSELCMNCHKESLDERFHLNPHNVQPEKLAALSAKFTAPTLDINRVFEPPVYEGNEIACSACHREHHGDVDIAAMTDRQCQSCHQSDYHSFESDHTEFTNWPLERRQRIAFDHVSHSGKHFPAEGQLFDCSQCHVDDPYKNAKVLAPYQQSCQQCHDESLNQSGESGLALIALPMLDTDVLKQLRLDVGQWPAAATGDYDGELPPMMRLLLFADPDAAKILEERGADFSFGDLDPTKRSDSKDAARLVWAIKYLLYDLTEEGPGAIQNRLEETLGRELDSNEVRRLVGQLSHSVFRNAVSRWIPNLRREVQDRKRRAVGNLSPNKPSTWSPGSSEILAMRPAPSEELATNPLKGLILSKGAPSASTQNSNQNRNQTVESTGGRNNDALQNNGSLGGQIPKPNTDANSELLIDNPLKAMGSAASGTRSLSPQGQSNHPMGSDVDPVTRSKVQSANSPRSTARPVERSTVRVSTSGWQRDDREFKISYRPEGHEDRLIQSWLNLVVSVKKSDERSATQPLFHALTSGAGVGSCRQCHTVDKLANGTHQVNWKPYFRDASIRAFTRFSHGPHLIQSDASNCSECHLMNEQRSNAHSFVDVNGRNVASNFEPIVKANCVNCHRSGATDNRCSHCHSYHVGSKVMSRK